MWVVVVWVVVVWVVVGGYSNPDCPPLFAFHLTWLESSRELDRDTDRVREILCLLD